MANQSMYSPQPSFQFHVALCQPGVPPYYLFVCLTLFKSCVISTYTLAFIWPLTPADSLPLKAKVYSGIEELVCVETHSNTQGNPLFMR